MSDFQIQLCSIMAVIGGFTSTLFGDLNSAFICLIVCMVVDYLTGIFVAIFNKSTKTQSGGLSSKVMIKGLMKKILMLGFIAVAQWIGLAMENTIIRDSVIFFFIASEVLSIVENGGLLGIKYPDKIKNIIDELSRKDD